MIRYGKVRANFRVPENRDLGSYFFVETMIETEHPLGLLIGVSIKF